MAANELDSATSTYTAAHLYEQIVADESLFILDVRNEDEVARWPIEGHRIDTLNIPYFEFLEDEDASVARLPDNRDMLVLCAKGGASDYVAAILQERGFNATNLDGGMISVGNYYNVRDVAARPYGRVVQVARMARGDLSFMLVSDGQAMVIDPLRHIDNYLRVADEAAAEITVIADTHAHADHISGGTALSRHTGKPYYLHPYDAIHPMDMLPARIEYLSLGDGERFKVGQFDVEVIWFPGHTLGMVNFLAHAPNGETFLFTGDGLFLRSFGRPDLGGQAETWTPMLYESIFHRLPPRVTDDALMMPGHFGTVNESRNGGIFAAPLGQVRRLNEHLLPHDKKAFIEYVLGHLPVFPPQYIEIKRVNLGLSEPSEEEASELELGKNICALEHSSHAAL